PTVRRRASSFRRPSAAASLAWIVATTLPLSSAASTLAKPVTTSPPLPAIASASSAARSRSFSVAPAKSAGARRSRLKPRAKTLRLTAWSTAVRVPVIQSPRPGSFRLTSGTISPAGPRTNRISSSTGLTSRVRAQVRSLPGATLAAPRSSSCSCTCASTIRFLLPRSSSLFRFRFGLLGRRIELSLGDPAGLQTRLHDDRLGVLAADIEAIEIACHVLGLAVLSLGPTDQIVCGAAGEVLDGLHVVLAEGDQHLGGDARDVLEFVCHAE